MMKMVTMDTPSSPSLIGFTPPHSGMHNYGEACSLKKKVKMVGQRTHQKEIEGLEHMYVT